MSREKRLVKKIDKEEGQIAKLNSELKDLKDKHKHKLISKEKYEKKKVKLEDKAKKISIRVRIAQGGLKKAKDK